MGDDKTALIGRRVRITQTGEPYYSVDHVGEIYSFDGVHYWVDFNNPQNDRVYGDGRWCIDYPNDSELIESAET
jgi:hypothetical protein